MSIESNCRMAIAASVIVSCAWGQSVAAQSHAVSIQATCEGPVAVGDTLHCTAQICHADTYGDTIEVVEGYAIVDPDGAAIRVPPVGNLPIQLLEGNVVAASGELPAVIGENDSTLGGLPGLPTPGYVTVALDFVVGPGLPEILPVRFTWVVIDQCDSPDTQGCFSFPNALEFVAATLTYCKGDANGDGSVNVDDLNAVILDWGTDGSANGGDVSGAGPGAPPDGAVDINDLVTVIVSWGLCP